MDFAVSLHLLRQQFILRLWLLIGLFQGCNFFDLTLHLELNALFRSFLKFARLRSSSERELLLCCAFRLMPPAISATLLSRSEKESSQRQR